METLNLSETQLTSWTKSVIPNRKRRLKPDSYRIITFKECKYPLNSRFSAGLLSTCGFSYNKVTDKIWCEYCQLTINPMDVGVDPKFEHINRSPSCPFVVERFEFPKKSDPDADKDEKKPDASNEQLTKLISLQIANKALFNECLPEKMLESARLTTFSNWPAINPSIQQMCNAGWWYTNLKDRVICIYCDTIVHGWSENSNPFELHRLKSPMCPFIVETQKALLKKNPSVNSNNMVAGSKPSQARYLDYALVSKRIESFKAISAEVRATLPSVETFAEAGFFYTGSETIVRCFHCGGTLRNWQEKDEPKIEHARWFPHCIYSRQLLGENLYQAIQRKSREMRGQQAWKTEGNQIGLKTMPWTNEEREKMVIARMDLPIVRTLAQQFSAPVIRKAFDMQLLCKKDDFLSDLDLKVACVILKKQMDLIKGQANNILIAKTWQPENEQQNNRSVKTLGNVHSRVCMICQWQQRQVACIPCGHIATCNECGIHLNKCPVCLAMVEDRIRIYPA